MLMLASVLLLHCTPHFVVLLRPHLFLLLQPPELLLGLPLSLLVAAVAPMMFAELLCIVVARVAAGGCVGVGVLARRRVRSPPLRRVRARCRRGRVRMPACAGVRSRAAGVVVASHIPSTPIPILVPILSPIHSIPTVPILSIPISLCTLHAIKLSLPLFMHSCIVGIRGNSRHFIECAEVAHEIHHMEVRVAALINAFHLLLVMACIVHLLLLVVVTPLLPLPLPVGYRHMYWWRWERWWRRRTWVPWLGGVVSGWGAMGDKGSSPRWPCHGPGVSRWGGHPLSVAEKKG